MLRRTCLRLLVALALTALVSSAAQAGDGVRHTSPFQFANWTGDTLSDVTVTHYYGSHSDTYHIGDVQPGQVKQAGTVVFYTNGSASASYWTVTADVYEYMIYRSLERYDLYDVDAGVMFTMDMVTGPYNWFFGTTQKLDLYSNNGSKTGLPVAYYEGD